MLYEGGLASRRDNPLGGAVFDVMLHDEVSNALSMPAEAVTKICRHSAAYRGAVSAVKAARAGSECATQVLKQHPGSEDKTSRLRRRPADELSS
jgi:hypothetical protein